MLRVASIASLLLFVSIGAVGAPSPQSLRGTWVLEVEGRNLLVIKVELGSQGLSGTLQRPTSMVLSRSNLGVAFSGIRPPIYTSQVTPQRSTSEGTVFSFIPPGGSAKEFLLRSEGDDAARLVFDASHPDGESIILTRADDSAVVASDWNEGKTYFVRAPEQSPNAELAAIFAADQADRPVATVDDSSLNGARDEAERKRVSQMLVERTLRGWTHIDKSVLGPRDEARRKRVRQMLDQGLVRTADDYYCAAYVFQHGTKPEDFLLAHTLAMAAVALGRVDASGISSMSLDRFLQSIDRPQIFGTQLGQGKYDSTLIPDSLRGVFGVPTLAEQEALRRQMESRE